MATIGKNQFFEIKNGDGSSFHNLVLRKSAVESIVMSLGDKISGDVYYKDNSLSVTMHEYITYNGVNYMLINPPTIVREGVVSDNSELRGMTKYSFVFYHPMCQLSNFPFTDVAVTSDETRYLSESKVFSWIGKPADFVAKMNKNLDGTEWIVEISSRFPQDKLNELSDVIPFDNATIADACKIFYDTWGVPYVVDKVASTEASYATGKRFKLVMGLPSNEIYENASAEQQNIPFVFQMGHGVGLKNNSRTPRNNKIITRISGYGSENNIPYGYPQVRWYGTAGQSFTYGDHAGVYTDVTIGGVHFDKVVSYPIYKGILNGEYVELIKHPFTRTHLMPSVYRTTLFNKISLYDDLGEVNTDYDPDITLVDYYDAIYSAQYPYPNTINLQAPSYESHEFEDEKPELGEAHIISATPLNNDLTPASSWDDSLDDEGNYKQSYFQMVLPQLSFDLYACASITEEMQINMRSGACLGCTFTVQVDWDDYKRNFYDDEGNFAPNGSQRDLTKYPKSNQGSISLVLQKDNSTFGTLMPNMYQYPKGETSSGAGDGDTFVILGISLPESYIFAAEWRLDADMKSYMLENNVHYFDYPLKFDEDFLFHKEYILSQIRPNTVVRFNYAGQTQTLFVKQITVKYGEQPLPQYDITLTDNVEVVLNQIGQVAEDVEKLSTLIAILRQSYGKNVWNELAKKLSKTQDDTAAGYITMLKGLQVGANFVPDILGEGGVLRMRDDGKVELVTDILYARMRAYFDSVVIREYRHESGNRIKSPAQGFNASRVEYIKVISGAETIVDDASVADYFRCYWRVDDGEKKTENQFIIGDLAFCEHSDIVKGSLVTKRYWRVVRGRNAGNTTTADGEAWIDLSNAHDVNGNPVMTTISWEGQGGTTQTLSVKSFESSANSYPEAHDDICMLGCVVDTTRQGAIIEYVSGVDAPTYQIYQGLGADATNPYSLSGKNQIGFGYNTSTGRAYMNVYGDAYIGARDRSTFIEYKQSGTGGNPELNIKAKIQILPNGSTIDGESISDYIKDNQNNYDDTEVQQAISDLNDAVGNLQDQIDGSIETLYGDVDPSVPANDPYKDYTTDEKEKHLGDMYYNSTTGYAYRYDKSVEEVGDEEVTTYFWQIIRDTGITQAIAKAAEALGLAGSKAKTYTTANNVLPSAPYNVGDLWLNATGTWGSGANAVTWENEILKCINACPAGGTPDISDWAKASKYTDDSAFNGYINAFLNGSGASGDSATAAAIQKAIAGALGSGTVVDGGLLLSSLIGMRKYKGSGSVTELSSYDTWGGISGEYNDDDETVEGGAKGHGIAAWYGGDMVDKEMLSDEEIAKGWGTGEGQYRWAKSIDRFDGSGYRADGNITWDEQGRVSIKDVTTIISSNNTNVLNELITFNNAFHFNLSQGTSTVLSIEPQAAFTNLYIRNTTNPNAPYHVATEDWVDDHYVSKTFFRQLFRAFKPNTTAGQADVEVQPNTIDATISNIKAMVGFWTEQYVSALGNNSDGGGGGASVLYGLNDVTPNATGDGVMGAQDGYVLTYNGSTHHWYAAATAETYVLPQATANALGGIKIGYAASGKNYAVALDTNGKAYVNVPWTDHYDWGDITNTPNTIAGYGITDAYTKTEVDSLARLESVAFSSDGVLAFTLQDGSVSYADLTHQHDFQEILDKPTTLAGFGITDAKIESGVITLGDNTITPVTSVAMTVPKGFSISGTPISKTGTLALSYSSGYEGFTTELKNMITALYSWFEVDSNGDIKTKDYTSNGTTKHRGFWSPSFISALGQGSDSGGGGQGDVTWELLQTQATDDRYIHLSYISAALESYLTTNNYVQSSDIGDMATKTWVGNQGYLTQQSLSSYYTKSEVDALARLTNVAYSSDGILAFTHQDGSTTYADFTHEHSFLELLDRPTTIAGYEISDVYINSGVVYIGNSSITPVTSVAMTVPTGFSISGSPISKTGTLAVSYASGYEGFTTSLKEKIEALFSWFELDSDGNVKTKDYVDNGTTKHRGFWSESFISALGEGNDGGGGGQGDVTWELLKQTATDGRYIDGSYISTALNGYATQSWVQSQGYITQAVVDVLEFLNTVTGGSDILTLTTNKGNSTIVDFTHNHEFLELTDRPTTIAGYGIEDAKIVNGVITLGTNTITPLTSHQSVTNNNISVTWDTETTIATIGSTAIKIKIPANPDTNTWRNIFKDGTEQLTTGINTKGLNFVGDGKTTITFLAAGTGEGQSGNANYATLKIGSTWRGIQDNLTSDSTTDSLSAAQGKALKGSITTLEGYFTNGVAKSAAKLTTVSKTAWGQTFWTSGGVPTSISGALSSVTNITMSGYIKIGDAYLAYDSTNNAIKLYKLDANNQEIAANFYALGAISALGQGVDGGGGGQGDVTWEALHTQVTSSDRTIHSSYIADTLAGYSLTSHTHTTTITTDSGTNQLTLAYGTKYKITAGGTSFVFTMPSADDTNTWRNIYVAGTEKIGSAVSTKGLNFAAGSNVSLSFTAAGSGTGQNANYGTITISATDTTYSVATQSANGLMSAADKTKLDGLEYFNAASRSSDGVVTLTTNKSNTTILDLTHQHSFLELVDRPTTLAGYGITDAVASIVINGTSYLPTNKVVTLPVYTSIQVDALARLKTLALTNDGLLTFTHQDNSISVVDFSHEHSFLELTDRPTTVAGYGITDMGSQSVNYATSASKATNDSDGNAINSTYLKKSGGTMTGVLTINPSNVSSFQDGIILNDKGTGGSEALTITWTSGSYPTGVKLSANLGSNLLIYHNGTNWYNVLTAANSSVSKSGETLTVKIAGVEKSLTNTNTWRGIQDNLTSSSNTTESLSAKQGYLLANGSARDNTKLPLAGGTMTGTLHVNNIEASNSQGLLAYHPTGWSYVSSSQWGLGALDSEGVIRSSASALKHYRNNEGTYEIIDSKGGQTINSSLQIGTANGAYIQVGSIRLVYDSTNNAIKVVKSDGTNANLYATGGVSALGAGQESGGGDGDVTWAHLASAATGGRTIHSSYISSTLGGYMKVTSTGGAHNANSIYDAGLYELSTGSSNLPFGAQFGVVLSLPYRNAYGNTSTDFSTQIALPNGDDSSYPNSMFYRTSLRSSWNAWQRVQNVSMSDVRLKTILSNPTFGIEQIANAPIIRYLWSKEGYGDKKVHIGSTAQYWMNVSNEFVDKEFDGYYSLQYGVAALVSAITTARKVVDHEKEIAQLKERVSALEKENELLKLKIA